MKDEEMAEEYIEKNCKIWEEGELTVDEIVRLAYLAGLKAGRPQWHDLEKDENDLPDNYRYVCTNIGACYYDDVWHCWRDDYSRLQGVIAWCEIPTFDKE